MLEEIIKPFYLPSSEDNLPFTTIDEVTYLKEMVEEYERRADECPIIDWPFNIDLANLYRESLKEALTKPMKS